MAVNIHFLNVGHGDCTIIEHESGNLTMIDINNGEELDDETASEIAESFGYKPEVIYNVAAQHNESPFDILKQIGYDKATTNPIEYFKSRFPNRSIFRFIQTHPDLDHMRGIRCFESESISIINFWDTNHTKEIEEFWFDSDEEDWNTYQKIRKGDNGIKVLRLNRLDTGHYWNTHPTHNSFSDGLYILAPTPELTDTANQANNHNNHSYVLMLIYAGAKVILGGDAGEEVWDSIVEAHAQDLPCDILKASHHGRDSGYHDDAVKLMNPTYTIVSVGKKPETDASNKYKNHTIKKVYSTRWHGNTVVSLGDNGQYTINTQYNNV